MKILMKTFTVLSIVFAVVVLSACSKDEPSQNNDDNDDPFASLKTGGINAENDFGLVLNISIDDISLAEGDDFIINYTIENTSEEDINGLAYIALELVYEKPTYLLDVQWGDYYSLLWWQKASYGHDRKAFLLDKNSTFSQSVDFTDIGWIGMEASGVQPDIPNFYDLFGAGHFKFQLHISIDDYNQYTETVTIFSNIIELNIE